MENGKIRRHRSLKEKCLVEINLDHLRIRDFFLHHFRFVTLVIGALLFLGITFISISHKASADIAKADLFAGNCAGDWQNPVQAEGMPDVSPGASDFTNINSAYSGNKNSELGCGNFKGETPPQAVIKKFTLHFSWLVAASAIIPTAPASTSDTLSAPQSSPGTATGATETPITPPADASSVEIPQSNGEQNISTPDAVTPPANAPEIPVQTPVQETPTTPAPVDTPAGGTSAPVPASDQPSAFLQKILSVAHAQDTGTVDQNNIATGSTVNDAPVTTTVVTVPTEDFLEVRYSLDGTNWKVLGTVNSENWKDASFDIVDTGLLSFDDIAKLQVSVKMLNTNVASPIVYIDSMYIEATYENIVDTVTPPDAPTVSLNDSANVDVVTGDTDFGTDDTPTFVVFDPQLSKTEIEQLIQEKKAEVVLDPGRVLQGAKSAGDEIQQIKQAPIMQNGAQLTPLPPAVNSVVEPVKNTVDTLLQSITPDTSNTNATTDTIQTPDVPVTSPDTPVQTPTQTPAQTPPAQAPASNAPAAPVVPDTTPQSSSGSDSTPPVSFSDGILNVLRNLFSAVPAIAQTADTHVSDVAVYNAAGEVADIAVTLATVTIDGVEHQEVKLEKPTELFKPGKYTLRVTLQTPDVAIVSNQDFTWGVLTLNSDQSIYKKGDTAYLQMGVLSDLGHTICDASLRLAIKSPSGAVSVFQTSNDSIVSSPECGPDNVISVPDYYAHYKIPNEIGTYQIALTATTVNGVRTIHDSFNAVSSLDFDIQRIGPTRIFPYVPYPFSFHIKSKDDFHGVVVETVPAGFLVSAPTDGTTGYDKVVADGDIQRIEWDVDLSAGVDATFGYRFDAPDVSPEVFLLGPMQLYASEADVGTSTPPVFQEVRRWQIASDAACASPGGSTTGTWTGITWSCGHTPTTSDTVTITAGDVITLNADTAVLGALTVNGTLYTSDGTDRALSATTVTIGAAGKLASTQSGGTAAASTITLSGTSGTIITLTAGGVFTAGTSTVISNGGASTTLNSADFTGSNKFYNLTVTSNGGTTRSLGGNIEVANTFAVTQGTLDTVSGTNWNITAGSINLTTGGSSTLNARASTITLNGTSGTLFTKGTGTFTAGTSTVIMNPNADVTLLSGTFTNTNAFGSLTLSPVLTGNHTYTLGATSITVATLTINPSGSSNVLTVNPSGTTDFSATGTLLIEANSANASVTTTAVFDTTVANSYAVSMGFLDIRAGGGFTANNSSLTFSSTTGTALSIASAGATFSGGTSTVTLTGSGSTTINGGSGTFTGNNKLNNLTLNASGGVTKSLGANLDLGGILTITAAAFSTSSSNWNLSASSISMALARTFTANASTITLTGTSGTLFTNNGGTFTAGTSTVVVTSASGSVVFSGGTSTTNTFYILKIAAGSGAIVNAGATIVTNNTAGNKLWIASGVFNQEGRTITPGTAGTLQIDSGATYCLGGTTGSTTADCASGATQTAATLPNFATKTFDANSTFIYLTDAAVSVTSIAYGNLKFTPKMTTSRVYTLPATLVIAGSFDIKPLASAGSLAFTANMASGGVNVTGTTTIQPDTTNTPTAKLVLSPSNGNNFPLTTGKLDIEANGTLDGSTNTATSAIGINGTTSTLFTNNGTFSAGGTTVTVSGNGSATFNTGSGGFAFSALTFSGTGTKTLGATISIASSKALTISAGTFDPTTLLVTGSGSNTLSVANGATINVGASTFAGNYSAGFTTRTLSAGSTVDYNLAGTQTIDSTLTYSNLTLEGAGTKTLSGATTINNNLTVSAGTLADGGNQITGNVTGTFTLSSGATLQLGTTGTATTFPTGFTNAHTSLATISTVVYNATVNQTISGTPTYGGLQLSAASGTPTKTLGAATVINGSLTVDASNTLDASGSNYQITLGGNFVQNGTFTPRSGLVLLNGNTNTTQQTLSGSGTFSFYDLTITNSYGTNASDDERTGFVPGIIFAKAITSTHNFVITTASVRVQYLSGATYTFSGINWNGQASGTKIFFRNSATSGTWSLVVTGTQTAVSYVNVSRSDASGGNPISSDATDYNGGNNTNWGFGLPVSGTANGNDGATIRAAVNGVLDSHTGTISSGTWSISVTTPSAGDIITIWVDGVANTNESTAVTKYSSGTAITGMVLNTNVLSIGSNQNTSLSITNLSLYTSVDNEDIMQSVSSGTLSVQGTGNTYTNPTLSVLSGNTLTVGTTDAVTTGLISIAGTVTSTGNATYTLTGTSGTLFANTGVFTEATSTVTLSGNGTATISSGTLTFYNLTSSGTGTKSFGGTATISHTLTISAGTLDTANNTLSAGSIVVSGGTFTPGSSTVNLTGTSGTLYTFSSGTITSNTAPINLTGNGSAVIASGTPTFYSLTSSGTGTKSLGEALTVAGALTVSAGTVDTTGGNYVVAVGNIVVNGGTLTTNGSAITLAGTAGTLITVSSGTLTANTSSITISGAFGTPTFSSGLSGFTVANLTASGATTLSLGEALNISGALTISGTTFSPGAQTITLSGSGSVFTYTSGGYTAGTETIKLTDTSSSGKTFAGGGQTYNNIWFTGTGSGSYTISGSNTFNDFKDDNSVAHSLLFTTGTTTSVTTFTVSGHVGALITITSTTTGTHTLHKNGGGTISSDYLNVQHSVATPVSTWDAGSNSVNNQSVATAGSGWTFGTPIISVVVSANGTIAYGIIPAGTSKDTTATGLNTTPVLTNDGSATENFNIKGQNSPECPWTLAGTIGTDQYKHEFSTNGGSTYTALTTAYQTLATGIASTGTKNVDLKITAPSSSACSTQQTVDVTIEAVAP